MTSTPVGDRPAECVTTGPDDGEVGSLIGESQPATPGSAAHSDKASNRARRRLTVPPPADAPLGAARPIGSSLDATTLHRANRVPKTACLDGPIRRGNSRFWPRGNPHPRSLACAPGDRLADPDLVVAV